MQTPYHILLSSLLQNDESDDGILFAISDFQMDNMIDALSMKSTFDNIIKLPGNFSTLDVYPSEEIITKYNTRMIKDSVSEYGISELFCFNDIRPEFQGALNAFPEVTGSFVEDGSAVYIGGPSPKWSKFGALRQKFFHGFWRENVRVMGTSSYTERIYVCYPDLVRCELKGRNILPVPTERISHLESNSWVQEFARQTETRIPWSEIDILLLLPLSSHDYGFDQSELINHIRSRGPLSDSIIGVKPHPRDMGDFDQIDTDNLILLPPEMPAEVIYILSDELSYVIGPPSTALISATWISDTVDVVSYEPPDIDYTLTDKFGNIMAISALEEINL